MDVDMQLLVHARAPSNAGHDSRYKAQAATYSALQESTIRRVTRLTPDDAMVAGTAPANAAVKRPLLNALLPPKPTQTSDSPWFIEDTQLAYDALQSQMRSSTSVVCKQTPAKAAHIRTPFKLRSGPRIASSNEVLSQSGSQQSTQSSYLKTPNFGRESKRARLDCDGLERDNSRESVEYREADLVLSQLSYQPFYKATSDLDEEDEPTQSAQSTDQTSSHLRKSYRLGGIAFEGVQERAQPSERSISDPGPMVERYIQSLSPRPGREVSSPERRKRPAEAEVSADGPIEPSNLTLTITLDSMSTVIEAPSPEASLRRFTTHVTPLLRHLDEDPLVSDTFNPLSFVRTLERLERGYWAFDCAKWSLEWQVSFWKMLEIFIGSGAAGWAIRCVRGSRLCHGQAISDSGSVDNKPEDDAFGPVQVYCWGEVARHIYLLLYVASSSRVRKLGLRWLDSEGNVVITMPGDQG